MFNKLFGPSINLLILDMFIEHPGDWMNVREIARMVDKNPGSISRSLPQLVEQGFLEQVRVGKNIYAYHLNSGNSVVGLLLELHVKLLEVGV